MPNFRDCYSPVEAESEDEAFLSHTGSDRVSRRALPDTSIWTLGLYFAAVAIPSFVIGVAVGHSSWAEASPKGLAFADISRFQRYMIQPTASSYLQHH